MKKAVLINARKWLALIVVMLTGLFLLSGCGRSVATEYSYAQDLLAVGEYESALYEFQSLGEYEDSGKFVLYVSGLMALDKGDYSLAQTDFENLNDFKNSKLYDKYVEAKALEAEEDYASAQVAFKSLGSFKDSLKHLENCTAMIPQKAYENALALYRDGEYDKAMDAFLKLDGYSDSAKRADDCQQAILSKSYQDALDLLKRKDLKGALNAFAALGSFRDSAVQADSCRQELYKQAEDAQKEGSFAKVQEAIALYESLSTYGDAARKAQDLKGRYDTNLKLRGFQDNWQYVSLGTYPQDTSGKSPILWRVLSVENGTALLLSDQILDTAALSTETACTGYSGSTLQTYLNGAFATEAFSAAEQAALVQNGAQGKVFLLNKEDILNPVLGFTADSARQAKATAYAKAKSIHASSTGSGWWWLNTAGTSQNCQAIVYYNGVVYSPGLQYNDAQTGVRPAIRVKLDMLLFSKGTGTAADPFMQ